MAKTMGVRSNRRQFLKMGAAGLAGAAAGPVWLRAGTGRPSTSQASPDKVIKRTLGKTGIRLPIVSIGAGAPDAAIYKEALDKGIVHIDTSQYYYNGKHETVVGEAIKGRPRDSFVVATSILIGSGQPGRMSTIALADLSQLADRFNTSLERLGLDYVDIFYVAGVGSRAVAFNDDLQNGLRKIKGAGKARFIGLATHQNEPEVLRAAVESKLMEVVLVSYNFRQGHRDDVQKAIGEAARAGLGIVVMKPMAGGFWDRERKQPINARAALKWALQDPNVHTSVPGIRSLEELNADLSIMDNLELTTQEMADLKLEDPEAPAGLYCQACGNCLAECPSGMNIPVLMRSYMYAYGYGDPARARGALDQAGDFKVACSDCAACRVHCSMGFDLKDRVQDIARLKAVPPEFLG